MLLVRHEAEMWIDSLTRLIDDIWMLLRLLAALEVGHRRASRRMTHPVYAAGLLSSNPTLWLSLSISNEKKVHENTRRPGIYRAELPNR